jgi:hypothetical protein
VQKLFLFAVVLAGISIPALGKGSGGHSSGSRSVAKTHSSIKSAPNPAKCASCTRDSRGRIKRSANAKRHFQNTHPCPSTGKKTGACPGYVVDHVTPLKRGGADSPSNMEWQTEAQAKAKDKVE